MNSAKMVRAGIFLASFIGVFTQQPLGAKPGQTGTEADRLPSANSAPQRAASAATTACALHVWPAATTHTTFQGWTHAGAVDGAQRGIKGYPDLRAGAIDTAQQVQILAALDWRDISGDPNLVVVVHPEPTGSDDDRSRTKRLVVDGHVCYRELIITSSLVEAAVFSTRSVRILALRKTFDGSAPPTNFSSMTKAVITLPEKIQPNDPQIDIATRAAFAVAVRKFAVAQSFH